jgi:RES domain
MLLYRVFGYDRTARSGESGHPLYLHTPQGRGRIDNPLEYDSWYFGTTPECAVGEVFGNLPTWDNNMFEVPYLKNGLRSLAIFSISDDLDILDLDDAQNLVPRGLRPTKVVTRNRSQSQA